MADVGNNRIRKLTNGIITTIAGTGAAGFGGDNGPATSALLSAPTSIALDPAGNLYIADWGNFRVRRVSNGIITTIAGNGTAGFSGDNGPAVSAQVSNAINVGLGISCDAAGNLYIADSGNHRVRVVSNGIISTIAGNGTLGSAGDGGPATAAQLEYPTGVAVDSKGNLYIADAGANRVRVVSNGVISTIAGSATQGFAGGGLAASSQLNVPYGVAVDTAGNVLIADGFNRRVRRISGGVINSVMGNGTDAFSGDGGPATLAQLQTPAGVALDAANNLYVADEFNGRVRKVTMALLPR